MKSLTPFLFPFLFMSFCTLLIGCASYAGTSQFGDLDFPAIIAGRGSVVRIDAQGKVSVNAIEFLKNESIAQWDVVGLDQIITTDKVDADTGGDFFDVKYYKNKTFIRSYRVENARYLTWMLLIPEKNCIVLTAVDAGGAKKRLVKIDLITGDKHQVVLNVFPYIKSKPLWDKGKGNLIIVLTQESSETSALAFDSMARLDLNDLSFKNIVTLDDAKIDGLLFADSVSNHVTAYGMTGGKPLYLNGVSGVLSFDLATGKSTMIYKDIMPGVFMYDHTGIAAVNDQYILLTKVGGYSFENPKSYCLDLKTQNWMALVEISAFKYPISYKKEPTRQP